MGGWVRKWSTRSASALAAAAAGDGIVLRSTGRAQDQQPGDVHLLFAQEVQHVLRWVNGDRECNGEIQSKIEGVPVALGVSYASVDESAFPRQ